MLQLKRFRIVAREVEDPGRIIAAKSADQAWAKFSTLYFNALKPDREDFSVSYAEEMPGYKITTESGYSWCTSMAHGITLADAREYFMGQEVNIAAYPQEKMERVTEVQVI